MYCDMPGLFIDNKPKPVKDTKTGIVYRSKCQAGKALALEFDLDPDYRLVWYQIFPILQKSYPKRVIEIKTGKPV